MKEFVYRNFIENTYYVIWYWWNKKHFCKFIKITEKGYNFLDLNTGKYLFKKHLYANKLNHFYVSSKLCYSTELTKEEHELFKPILRVLKINKILNKLTK